MMVISWLRDIYVMIVMSYDSLCCQCSFVIYCFCMYFFFLIAFGFLDTDAFGSFWQWLLRSSVEAPQNLRPAVQRSWLLKSPALTVKLRLLRRCGMWHEEHCVVKAEV